MSIGNEKGENEKFIEEIYLKYHPIMMKKSYEILKDTYLAEDTIQDTMISLIKKVNVIKGLNENQLVSYVVEAVRNKSINYKKSMSNYYNNISIFEFDGNDLKQDNYVLKDLESEVEKNILQKEQLIFLKNVLLSMSERDRKLLYLRFVKELSYAEISNIVAIDIKQVGIYISRAKKRFLKLIN